MKIDYNRVESCLIDSVNQMVFCLNHSYRILSCKSTMSTYEAYNEYDANGNHIHYKNSDGGEFWTDRNSYGDIVHFKNCDGYEDWSEYDSNRNRIHYYNTRGYEEWCEVDDNGIIINFKNTEGEGIY